MRCLVSGAAGFIGSHLCERLLSEGHSVIGVDNMTTGRMDNLNAIIAAPKFKFIEGDINLHDFTYITQVDWVFHLAAKADVVPSIESPFMYHHANVTGTIKMLEWARKLRAKKFVYAASSSCYGIPDHYPTTESAPASPQYPYALTKYVGEQYVMHWAKVYKLPVTSLRLFNVYGPRSRTSGAYGAVFGVFLSQLANDKPITIVGDGEQSRDFVYVTDVAEAFIKAAHYTGDIKVFNVGTGKAQSVNYLAELLGATSKEFLPDRPGEPRKTQACIEKIKTHLHWEPKTSFEQGVAIMKDLAIIYKRAPLWCRESIENATKLWFKYLG